MVYGYWHLTAFLGALISVVAYAERVLGIVIVEKGMEINLFKTSLVGGIYAVLGGSTGWLSAYFMYRRESRKNR